MTDALRLESIHAGYVPGIEVLSGIDLAARDGEITTVIGANGVGKSTLLKVVVGELAPRSGRVLAHDRDITGLATHRLIDHGVAYVAQRHTVFTQMTVEENLAMGLWPLERRSGREARGAALDRAWSRMPQLRQHRKIKAGALSGGQQRLLELERALMADPAVLLIDEPSVGLDPKRAGAIYEHLRALAGAGVAILLVDQNVIMGTEIADRIAVLDLGRNRITADRAEFDRDYRDDIASWLF